VIQKTNTIAAICSVAWGVASGAVAFAADPIPFESHLFKMGSLVYADDFEGDLDQERWQPRTKTWGIKDGILIGGPDYKDEQEAQRILRRDHHLGMSPVIRLNNLPAKFVLHMRLQFEGTAFGPGRPKVDVGHHINTLVFTANGYSMKLHDGPSFSGDAPAVRLNDWIELVIEFQEGKMWVGVNGKGQTIQHENVSLKGRDELTFKTFAKAPNRILFDSVKLWEAE